MVLYGPKTLSTVAPSLILMAFLTELLNTPWFGSAIGLIGIVLALFFYLRSRTVRCLAYQYNGARLIGGDNPGLPAEVVVMFKGRAVPRLTKSTVVLWNAGNMTIRGSDIVRADTLRLVLFEDANVLDVRVTHVKRSVNSITAVRSTNDLATVLLNFDFLDPQDGARIEVLHTSSRTAAAIVGTLRGLPDGCTNLGSIPAVHRRDIRGTLAAEADRMLGRNSLMPVILMVLGGLLTLGSMSLWRYQAEVPPRYVTLIGVLGGALYVCLGAGAIWHGRRRFARELDGATESVV